ncbi:MAG: amidohydrolase family protein, partial [Halobacteriales archaeon]
TEMRQASLLQKVEALDPTATPASSIIEMATLNGARAAGFDGVGAIREGWKADIIGLTTDVTRATPLNDVLGHLVFAAHGDDVRFTMIDGQVCYDDGELTIADADAIRRRAREVDLDLAEHREAAQAVKPSTD